MKSSCPARCFSFWYSSTTSHNSSRRWAARSASAKRPKSSIASLKRSQAANTTARSIPSPYFPPPCLSHFISCGRRRTSLSVIFGSCCPAACARCTRSTNSAMGLKPSYGMSRGFPRLRSLSVSSAFSARAASFSSRSNSRFSQDASKSRHSAIAHAAARIASAALQYRVPRAAPERANARAMALEGDIKRCSIQR